jgi:hypothetical protein
LAPNIEIERKHVMTPQGLEVRNSRILKQGGLQYAMIADENVVRLLVGCDGSRPLRALLEDMAAYLEVEWDRVVQVVLPIVASLVERSVLLALESPHGDAGSSDT